MTQIPLSTFGFQNIGSGAWGILDRAAQRERRAAQHHRNIGSADSTVDFHDRSAQVLQTAAEEVRSGSYNLPRSVILPGCREGGIRPGVCGSGYELVLSIRPKGLIPDTVVGRAEW